MANIDRDKLKRTFDQIAELYDKARPVTRSRSSTTCLRLTVSLEMPRCWNWVRYGSGDASSRASRTPRRLRRAR